MRAEELLTYPSVEPVSLERAKWHLSVDHDDDDPLIMDQIRAARAFVEAHTGTKLVRQAWRVYFDDGLYERDTVPPPVQEITQIQYIDIDGNTQTVASSVYELDRNRQKLRLAYNQVWPQTRTQANAAWMDVWSGYYTPTTSPLLLTGEIPTDLTGAILMLVDHLYEHRGREIANNMQDNPAFMQLIAPHRWMNR